jgi:hypothetical protein
MDNGCSGLQAESYWTFNKRGDRFGIRMATEKEIKEYGLV